MYKPNTVGGYNKWCPKLQYWRCINYWLVQGKIHQKKHIESRRDESLRTTEMITSKFLNKFIQIYENG